MECHWDEALLQRLNELPEALIDAIRSGSDEQYLSIFTQSALDSRYTYTLFAFGHNIFAHICADLRKFGSLPESIATLGRIVSFAPHLASYAQRILESESYEFGPENDAADDLLYLLGLFRLLRLDHRTFGPFVNPSAISGLLGRRERPVVYLAIRILQVLFNGADHWFEQSVARYLGNDTPESRIDGLWDGRVIDYRFFTLWEEEAHERMTRILEDARAFRTQTPSLRRTISEENFHSSTCLVGGVLLPRFTLDSTNPPLDGLVKTPTISQNLHSIASALKSSNPLLLTGLAGSGKTLLVRHVAEKLGKLDQMITLHLNEQSDAKLLVGIHATGDSPGSFVWRPGVLTTAVQEGRWVCIEDIDRAPQEIIGYLLPLIERGELLIPNRKQTIHAKQGFRIIATVRSSLNHRGQETKPLSHMLGRRHWNEIRVEMPGTSELATIVTSLYPSISPLLPQFVTIYERLQNMRQGAVLAGQSKTGVLRPISSRDLLKWCGRVTNLLRGQDSMTSSDIDDVFMEAMDCFVGALPDSDAKSSIAATIAQELRIDPQRRDFLSQRDVRYEVEKTTIAVGRYVLPRAQTGRKAGQTQSSFSTNPHTSRMLERVAAAVLNREPLLLVGETGVGKTTAVQHLASHLGRKLVPFNLSQQSEAGDLLGGFKPVNARSLMVPMKDEFDDLFPASFSQSKNQDFLDRLGKQMAKGNWKVVCKLLQHALKMVDQQRSATAARQGEAPSKKRKVESKKVPEFARWDAFGEKVNEMERRLAAGNENFAFSFVEGNIVKAVRNGDWILLDEINLASPDTLEALADLLDADSPTLLLTEAGSVERIEAHPDFRIFAAMNPATDVGKKDLMPGIRSRFTELYVESPDKDIKSLQSIVKAYLGNDAASDQAVALDVSTLYQKIIGLAELNKLVDGAGQKPHFSLRTLTRTLSYARYIAPQCSLRRALYEGFQMSFLTFLDAESSNLVQPLIEQHLFSKRTNARAELKKALRKPNDGHEHVQGSPESKHWVRRGPLVVEQQPQYIITRFIQTNLENLVRASSTRQFPVLIQGPTSSGKTSMIEYLAKRTGHKFVRINNHEHTDLQEYLGTYISGADGKLVFQEGILVNALREGHWIVLDELNLAPTDVLEALNRLLDDNRELMIPETQEVVRPHPSFMLFATQNPAGLYSGRKTLSRAFRNRFLELHFDDIPVDELQEILHKRTQLPESRCKRIVSAYRELSVLRQENRLFEQKSFATLRDLFRWALRPNDTSEQLASNGFMLLAERVRKTEEREAVKGVLEKVMSLNGPKVKIDETALYSSASAEITTHQRQAKHQGAVWTSAMRRLYTLVARAIHNREPVLLVGETGCGKTTVCQMLADALAQELHIVNAHQNTETGDLIGSQRPVRHRAAIEAALRDQLLHAPALQALDTAAAHSTDALLSAYDSSVQSLAAEAKQLYMASQTHLAIQASRTRYKALFEWADGSLVHAMRTGAFFLLDEISLADDSVLERINSVLEPSRSLLLAEKGSLDSFVAAAPGFQFFATMNPGGDYGKRELSPALRNRFTEIWVPALSDLEDVAQIVHAKLILPAEKYAGAMVAFAHWFKDQYNTSASSAVSIRDVLAWTAFANAFSNVDNMSGIVHGAAMVYIDTLGANPAGLMTLTGRSLNEERRNCLQQLSTLLGVDASAIYDAVIDVAANDQQVTFGPFAVQRRSGITAPASTFSFDAPTTKANAIRVVRAMQLPKPVMLEGSPGVGKTALVTAVADVAGVPLTRINLSEQTDLMDLFGSDTPVQGAEAGTFAWRDAPFLRAMKNGEWVLLDEMNLASQSVLEGLNACLDHRGEVFIPEIGQTFARHPDFKLFAAQNPHHQGGGRKGLPASFVNRFTVVYADSFRPEDLLLICQRTFPTLSADTIQRAVQFVSSLHVEVAQRKRFGAQGGPWEFNLRDITRWLSLVDNNEGLLKAGNARDFVHLLFSQRFRELSDRAGTDEVFNATYGELIPTADMASSLSETTLQLGLGLLPRDLSVASVTSPLGAITTISKHLHSLQSLMIGVQRGWPVILSGPSGVGKTALLQSLASTVGASVETFAMNAETDAMDLVGGYEQADPFRQSLQLLDDFCLSLEAKAKAALIGQAPQAYVQIAAELRRLKATAVLDPARLSDIAMFLAENQVPNTQALFEALKRSSVPMDKASFIWIDGILVDAMEQGSWLVLDNANLCSPSVLDRLNSLLEPNGSLIINEHVAEDGSPRIIRPHPSFRIFLTVDPRYGELSRAMRNRALEIHMLESHGLVPLLDPLQPESSVARFRQLKASTMLPAERRTPEQLHVPQDRLALRDLPLASRFAQQASVGLYRDLPFNTELQVAQHDHALKLDRSHDQLKAFYELAVSQKQVSADFARVQTIHPLNNQPLVQQSSAMSDQAMRLSFLYELNAQISFVMSQVEALQSDRGIVSRLVRLERAQTSQKKASAKSDRSTTLQSITGLFRLIAVRAAEIEIPISSLPSLKQFLQWLIGSMRHLLDVASRADINQALLSACYAVARDLPKVDSLFQASSLVLETRQALTSFGAEDTSAWGAECTTLWQHLKPVTPASWEQLESLMKLESIIQSLDQGVLRFQQPLTTVVELRVSFCRALECARAGGADVEQLAEKLRVIGLEASETPTEAVAPYFTDVFSAMIRHFATLSMSRPFLEDVEQATIETLALRPASLSLGGANMTASNPQSIFRLLEVVARSDTADEPHMVDQLAQKLSGTGAVALQYLPLLASETKTLGRLVAGRTHLISESDSPSLDQGLRSLVDSVLRAVSGLSKSDTRRQAAESLYRALSAGKVDGMNIEIADPLLPWAQQMQTAIEYLIATQVSAAPALGYASRAWTAFASACFQLFLPPVAFDPALEPLQKREVHLRVERSLADQLLALQAFESRLSGETDSLRTRLLEDDVRALGPAPDVPKICRPPVSEIEKLQMEFDGLRRIISAINTQSSVTMDAGMISNLKQLRLRLTEQYRAYDDLTTPIVGFIDCLHIGHHLAAKAASNGADSGDALLDTIVPFHTASFEAWSSDSNLVRALPPAASQDQTLTWLAIVAARSKAWHLQKASKQLAELVEQQFSRLYDQWRTELGRDQRQDAAKSSLYRYSGATDVQDDPTDEQLDELFSGRKGGAASAEPTSTPMRALAPRIATLHQALYSGDKLDADIVVDILREYATLSAKRAATKEPRLSSSLILLQLDQLTLSLAPHSSPNQQYNVYTDSNITQARKLLQIIQATQQRFTELQKAWPDHATPREVLLTCDQVVAIGHAEPLVRYLPIVEKLHAAVTEWQKIASRDYSANTISESITDLIVSWRQIELSSWAGLFDEEDRRTKDEATSWWFIAYETIVAATEALSPSSAEFDQHVVGLLKALEDFLSASGLGEFHTRLQLLRNFEIQLATRASHALAFARIHSALVNLIAWFGHFEPAVSEALNAGRVSLEKGIKDVIQVASWKDRNIDTLRQSAKASHRKLFRSVRRYRTLLAQPVTQIVSAGVPTMSGMAAVLPSEILRAMVQPTPQEESSVTSLRTWQDRAPRFRNVEGTVNLIETKSETISQPASSSQRLAGFLEDLTDSIKELQKATPALLTEKNKALVSHLKTRKRRLLADILKSIRKMGFQHNLSQDILSAQSTFSQIMSRLSVLPSTNVGTSTGLSQYHLHRLIGIMPSVRDGVRKHSDDLTPAEAQRCASYLESVLFLSTIQQNKLCQFDTSSRKLHAQLRRLENFATSRGPTIDHSDHASVESLSCVSPLLDVADRLVRVQSRLSGNDYSSVIEEIGNIARKLDSDCQQLRDHSNLPAGVTDVEASALRSNVSAILQQAQSFVQQIPRNHPELESLSYQLTAWLSLPSVTTQLRTSGVSSTTADEWTHRALNYIDSTLASIQGVEKVLAATAASDKDTSWLYTDQSSLESIWIALDPDGASDRLWLLMSDLQHVLVDTEQGLSALATISRTVHPIIRAFVSVNDQIISSYSQLHLEVNRMGYSLAASFVTLVKEGFCTPPDKSPEGKQDSGNVETGTGLGEGEGGEDISKDIGDEEDLSELAQEKNGKDKENGIEDEKDAVDMADQEMDGELGDVQEESESGEDNTDQEEKELEEETGSVGDLDDGAVDEKMWDDGKAEQENEKETDSGRNTTQDKDLSAAGEGEKEEGEAGEDAEVEEEDAAGPDEEDVSRRDTEAADPHMQEQENLDLPDDINMDGDKSDIDSISEVGSMHDDDKAFDAGEEEQPSNEDGDHLEKPEETESQDNAEDDATKTQEAGEGAEEEDDQEMKDDNMLQDKGDDAQEDPAEGDVAGEQGTGQDEDQKESQAVGGASADENNPEDIESAAQAQQESGTQGATNEAQTQEAQESSQQQSAANQRQSRYKELGDVLDEWYRQQRQIEAPQETDAVETEEERQDIDMSNATFEHLPDGGAQADTQALGTASADQSGALNEETSRAVNEEQPVDEIPFQETADDAMEDSEKPNETQDSDMEPSDELPPSRDAKAFVGEKSTGEDHDMDLDEIEKRDDHEDVQDVDEQLLRTHISHDYEQEQMTLEDARRTWSEHESSTRNLALILTEHLRLILQPTQATKMRGDFRTGKRLNIKRIIPYIASSYKRDKIWMRRSIPSKRSYQVMLAIDDSKSMDESDSRALAFDTLALVAKSMSMLEVGELCVLGFGENVNIAHDFNTPFTTEAGAEIFKSFTFAQSKTNVRKMLAESIELFRAARLKAVGSSSELWQLQLIISDGVCEDHPSIRQLVRQAFEERIMVVFVVVDATAMKTEVAGVPNQSIVDLQTAEFSKDAAGEMQLKMVKYLDTFPFRYYLIVRDVHELPGVLAGALRQWFSEVVESGV